jgi:hypothetical protein
VSCLACVYEGARDVVEGYANLGCFVSRENRRQVLAGIQLPAEWTPRDLTRNLLWLNIRWTQVKDLNKALDDFVEYVENPSGLDTPTSP